MKNKTKKTFTKVLACVINFTLISGNVFANISFPVSHLGLDKTKQISIYDGSKKKTEFKTAEEYGIALFGKLHPLIQKTVGFKKCTGMKESNPDATLANNIGEFRNGLKILKEESPRFIPGTKDNKRFSSLPAKLRKEVFNEYIAVSKYYVEQIGGKNMDLVKGYVDYVNENAEDIGKYSVAEYSANRIDRLFKKFTNAVKFIAKESNKYFLNARYLKRMMKEGHKENDLENMYKDLWLEETAGLSNVKAEDIKNNPQTVSLSADIYKGKYAKIIKDGNGNISFEFNAKELEKLSFGKREKLYNQIAEDVTGNEKLSSSVKQLLGMIEKQKGTVGRLQVTAADGNVVVNAEKTHNGKTVNIEAASTEVPVTEKKFERKTVKKGFGYESIMLPSDEIILSENKQPGMAVIKKTEKGSSGFMVTPNGEIDRYANNLKGDIFGHLSEYTYLQRYDENGNIIAEKKQDWKQLNSSYVPILDNVLNPAGEIVATGLGGLYAGLKGASGLGTILGAHLLDFAANGMVPLPLKVKGMRLYDPSLDIQLGKGLWEEAEAEVFYAPLFASLSGWLQSGKKLKFLPTHNPSMNFGENVVEFLRTVPYTDEEPVELSHYKDVVEQGYHPNMTTAMVKDRIGGTQGKIFKFFHDLTEAAAFIGLWETVTGAARNFQSPAKYLKQRINDLPNGVIEAGDIVKAKTAQMKANAHFQYWLKFEFLKKYPELKKYTKSPFFKEYADKLFQLQLKGKLNKRALGAEIESLLRNLREGYLDNRGVRGRAEDWDVHIRDIEKKPAEYYPLQDFGIVQSLINKAKTALGNWRYIRFKLPKIKSEMRPYAKEPYFKTYANELIKLRESGTISQELLESNIAELLSDVKKIIDSKKTLSKFELNGKVSDFQMKWQLEKLREMRNPLKAAEGAPKSKFDYRLGTQSKYLFEEQSRLLNEIYEEGLISKSQFDILTARLGSECGELNLSSNRHLYRVELMERWAEIFKKISQGDYRITPLEKSVNPTVGSKIAQMQANIRFKYWLKFEFLKAHPELKPHVDSPYFKYYASELLKLQLEGKLSKRLFEYKIKDLLTNIKEGKHYHSHKGADPFIEIWTNEIKSISRDPAKYVVDKDFGIMKSIADKFKTTMGDWYLKSQLPKIPAELKPYTKYGMFKDYARQLLELRKSGQITKDSFNRYVNNLASDLKKIVRTRNGIEEAVTPDSAGNFISKWKNTIEIIKNPNSYLHPKKVIKYSNNISSSGLELGYYDIAGKLSDLKINHFITDAQYQVLTQRLGVDFKILTPNPTKVSLSQSAQKGLSSHWNNILKSIKEGGYQVKPLSEVSAPKPNAPKPARTTTSDFAFQRPVMKLKNPQPDGSWGPKRTANWYIKKIETAAKEAGITTDGAYLYSELKYMKLLGKNYKVKGNAEAAKSSLKNTYENAIRYIKKCSKDMDIARGKGAVKPDGGAELNAPLTEELRKMFAPLRDPLFNFEKATVAQTADHYLKQLRTIQNNYPKVDVAAEIKSINTAKKIENPRVKFVMEKIYKDALKKLPAAKPTVVSKGTFNPKTATPQQVAAHYKEIFKNDTPRLQAGTLEVLNRGIEDALNKANPIQKMQEIYNGYMEIIKDWQPLF